jgi:hypothetical protein
VALNAAASSGLAVGVPWEIVAPRPVGSSILGCTDRRGRRSAVLPLVVSGPWASFLTPITTSESLFDSWLRSPAPTRLEVTSSRVVPVPLWPCALAQMFEPCSSRALAALSTWFSFSLDAYILSGAELCRLNQLCRRFPAWNTAREYFRSWLFRHEFGVGGIGYYCSMRLLYRAFHTARVLRAFYRRILTHPTRCIIIAGSFPVAYYMYERHNGSWRPNDIDIWVLHQADFAWVRSAFHDMVRELLHLPTRERLWVHYESGFETDSGSSIGDPFPGDHPEDAFRSDIPTADDLFLELNSGDAHRGEIPSAAHLRLLVLQWLSENRENLEATPEVLDELERVPFELSASPAPSDYRVDRTCRISLGCPGSRAPSFVPANIVLVDAHVPIDMERAAAHFPRLSRARAKMEQQRLDFASLLCGSFDMVLCGWSLSVLPGLGFRFLPWHGADEAVLARELRLRPTALVSGDAGRDWAATTQSGMQRIRKWLARGFRL